MSDKDMSELTIKDKVEETFVFGEHNFESVGDAPFNVLKCKHCDRFASHHLNYAVKESIMQLIDSAITEAVIKQLKLITEHPEDGCVWGVKQVGKRTHEALEWHEAQLKNNTTKQEDIKDE